MDTAEMDMTTWFWRGWTSLFLPFFRLCGYFPWSTIDVPKHFSTDVSISRIFAVFAQTVSILLALCHIFGIAVILDTLADVLRVPSVESRTPVLMVASLLMTFYVGGLLRVILLPLRTKTLHSSLMDLELLLRASPIPNRVQKRMHAIILISAGLMSVIIVTNLYLHTTERFPPTSSLFGCTFETKVFIALFQYIPTMCCAVGQIGFSFTFGYIAMVLAFAFSANNKNTKQLIYAPDVGHDYLALLTASRENHWKLTKAAEKLDHIFAPVLLAQIVCDVLTTTLLIGILMGGDLKVGLGVLVTTNTESRIFLTGCALCSLIQFYNWIIAASYVKSQAHGIITVYHEASEILKDSRHQVETITTPVIQRLRDNPVGFTAWKLISLDKDFLITIQGLLLTYLIVIYEIASRDGSSPCQSQPCPVCITTILKTGNISAAGM